MENRFIESHTHPFFCLYINLKSYSEVFLFTTLIEKICLEGWNLNLLTISIFLQSCCSPIVCCHTLQDEKNSVESVKKKFLKVSFFTQKVHFSGFQSTKQVHIFFLLLNQTLNSNSFVKVFVTKKLIDIFILRLAPYF